MVLLPSVVSHPSVEASFGPDCDYAPKRLVLLSTPDSNTAANLE